MIQYLVRSRGTVPLKAEELAHRKQCHGDDKIKTNGTSGD
jgi:hypothetical protein